MIASFSHEYSAPLTILRLPAVLARTGLSRSTLYALMAEGQFPASVSLGMRSVGWLESDITDWIRQRLVASGRCLPDPIQACPAAASQGWEA